MASHGKKSSAAVRRRRRRQNAFLRAFVSSGTIKRACDLTGTPRSVHYGWLAEDADYARRWAAAQMDANDTLVEEARRRAIHGAYEIVMHKGKPVLNPDAKPETTDPREKYLCKRIYSDSLLKFLIEKFEGRAAAQREPGSTPVVEIIRTTTVEGREGVSLPAPKDGEQTVEGDVPATEPIEGRKVRREVVRVNQLTPEAAELRYKLESVLAEGVRRREAERQRKQVESKQAKPEPTNCDGMRDRFE